jgi:hypothetical protein
MKRTMKIAAALVLVFALALLASSCAASRLTCDPSPSDDDCTTCVEGLCCTAISACNMGTGCNGVQSCQAAMCAEECR